MNELAATTTALLARLFTTSMGMASVDSGRVQKSPMQMATGVVESLGEFPKENPLNIIVKTCHRVSLKLYS